MIIKKLVVGSMFSMLLGSEMVAADWGDTYFCKMTNFVNIKSDGEIEYFKLETFQFKLDQSINAMVFRKGYFDGNELQLNKSISWPMYEEWHSNSSHSVIDYYGGKFLHTRTVRSIIAVSADCDKF